MLRWLHKYTFDRRKPDGTHYWQCRDKKQYTPPCTGRLYTSGKESVKRASDHNHPAIWSCCQSPNPCDIRVHHLLREELDLLLRLPTLALELLRRLTERGPQNQQPNNASEGSNNAIKHAATSDHPNIWSFIPTIRAYNSEMEQKILLLGQGVDPERPQRPRWRSREDTIKRLVATYNAADKMGTMRAVCLKFNPL